MREVKPGEVEQFILENMAITESGFVPALSSIEGYFLNHTAMTLSCWYIFSKLGHS